MTQVHGRGTVIPRTGSKHPVIRKELRRRIFRDGLSGRLPGMRVLAREFGVHYITIQKALDALVAEGLVRSEPGRGHFVTGRKLGSVVMLVCAPELGGGYYSGLARILANGLDRSHLEHRMVFSGSGGAGRDFPGAEELEAGKDSAVLSVGVQDREYLLSLMNAGLPVVAMDYVPTDPAITAVGTDGIAAGAEAMRHLIERGARDILFMGHGRSGRAEGDAILLEAGCRLAMEEAGLKVRSCYTRGCDSQQARELFGKILSEGRRPDAAFNSNRALSRGIRECCAERGIRVPEDMQLLQFGREYDDLPAFEMDHEHYCEAALEMIREVSARSGFRPRQVLLRPQLTPARETES